jgi:hypothetical protein
MFFLSLKETMFKIYKRTTNSFSLPPVYVPVTYLRAAQYARRHERQVVSDCQAFENKMLNYFLTMYSLNYYSLFFFNF